ncbi:MAG: ribosome-associated translation inhibitor RaiA [Anaerolineales bacterium]|nr:ribosome-associated translation inhibitor RaiA [Anaerolineales bacterium]MCB9126580.1 ribosome-associated translation inhibitor RaiA [Ardenticatenales bacterium]MCB9172494.1 ribosome-associated translation inhibitor RaiA [Ardenticatenales bacterium]
MDLSIQGHNVNITTGIEEYVEKRVGKLERYLPTLGETHVDIRSEGGHGSNEHFITQITLYDTHGTILRAEEQSSEIHVGVDLAVDKLHRQIKRFKGKRRDRYQRAPSHEELYEAFGADEEESEDGAVVRVKRFAMSPMDQAEAIEQMTLLGHSFFVFYNANEGKINVLYQRKDGDYGLIIPELV